jgi:AraC-like DNA-binding protein
VKLTVAPGEVTKATFRITAEKPGSHPLRLEARGSVMADAVERIVRVTPDGEEIVQTHGGTLEKQLALSVAILVRANETTEAVRLPEELRATSSGAHRRSLPFRLHETAERCGYSTASRLVDAFKRTTGRAPGEYCLLQKRNTLSANTNWKPLNQR